MLHCLDVMHGGEIFVPKIPSMNIMDLCQVVAPECQVDYIGIRPGEKMHEVLVSEDEARNTLELDDLFVILPAHPWWSMDNWSDGKPVPKGFRYASDMNPKRLSRESLRELVDTLEERSPVHV